MLLSSFSWQELRQHPWRTATALIAIMLGVALGFAVHVINQSALDEFSRAVRSVNGQPDLQLHAMQGGLPLALYPQVAQIEQFSGRRKSMALAANGGFVSRMGAWFRESF